jgi:hypothetical protein
MPVPTKRTQICLPPAFDSHDRRGIKRVTLRTITTFPNAHPLTLLAVRLLHERKEMPPVKIRPLSGCDC